MTFLFHLMGSLFFLVAIFCVLTALAVYAKHLEMKELELRSARRSREHAESVIRDIVKIAAETKNTDFIAKIGGALVRAGNNIEMLKQLEDYAKKEATKLGAAKAVTA